MWEREKNALRRLAEHDRRRVVSYWRALLWKRRFLRMPIPGKLGVINLVVTLLALPWLPPAVVLPAIFLPIFWSAIFSVSVAIVLLFPRRKVYVHWLD